MHAMWKSLPETDAYLPVWQSINRKSSSSHRSALSAGGTYRSFSIAWLHCAQRFGLAVPYCEFPPMSNSEIRHRVIHLRQLQLLTTTQQNSQTLVGLWSPRRRVSSAHCAHTCVGVHVRTTCTRGGGTQRGESGLGVASLRQRWSFCLVHLTMPTRR